MFSDFIAKLLAAAGFDVAELMAEWERIKAAEPDLTKALAQLGDIIFPKLAALLDKDTAAALVKKALAELAGGHPSYDPNHWTVA